MWRIRIDVRVEQETGPDEPKHCRAFHVEERLPNSFENIDDWEQRVEHLGFGLMRELFREGVGLVEDATLSGYTHRDASCHCQKRGTRPYTLSTVFGKVTFPRRRLRCMHCEEWVTPLNDALGLHESEQEHSTVGLKELSSLCALQEPYGPAHGLLQKVTRDESILSAKQMQLIAKKEGTQVRQQEESTRQRIGREDVIYLQDRLRSQHPPAPPVEQYRPGQFYICMDGIFLHSDEGKGRWREVKVGLLTNHEREPVGNKGRQRLPVKCYLSSFDTSDVFGSRVYSEALQMGMRDYEEVFVVGDGARWIRQIRKQCFPHAEYILDWYHLKEKVNSALRWTLYDKPLRREIRRAVTTSLWQGKREKALQVLEELRDKLMAQGKLQLLDKRHGLNELIAYIINNWEGIVYYEQMHKRGYVIASSLVEKAADVVVAKRQKKQQGMHWGYEGGDGIAALRTLWLNGEWDAHWQNRRSEQGKAA